MPTPLRERFYVQTNLRDKAAPKQTLDQVMLLVNVPDALTDRTLEVSLFDYKETLTEGTDEYTFATAFFGQTLKPETLLIVYRDNGTAAETVATALDAAIAEGQGWYWQAYIGKETADAADQEDLANYGESSGDRYQTVIQTNDVNAYDAGSASDIGTTLRDTTQNRTSVIFHPDSVNRKGTIVDTSEERGDAAILGRMSTTEEGSGQWDFKECSFISDSGLTTAQRNTLNDKGYNFFESPIAGNNTVAITYMYKGRTCTDREIRIQWGADWHDVSVEAGIFDYAVNKTDLMAFDDPTFTDVEGIFGYWRDQAISRRIILDTPGNFLGLPDPLKIDSATKASGIADFNDVYDYALNTAIDGWRLTGNWRVQ